MDVVYPLGKGSTWLNLEIKFSLRSIEKYLSPIGNVYIIGELPDFITNVYHLPWPDPHRCKERNIMEKVSAACRIKGISDDFLFMNDDIFLLAILSPATLPFYYEGNLQDTVNKASQVNVYTAALQNTHNVLSQKNFATLHYDIHVPIVYNKFSFPEIMKRFNWNEPDGFTIKSLYANAMNVEGVKLRDNIVRSRLTEQQLIAVTQDRKFFSIAECGVCYESENFLHKLYPEKSSFEI